MEMRIISEILSLKPSKISI